MRLSFPGLPERAADYRRELDVERVDGDLLTFSAKAGEPYRIG